MILRPRSLSPRHGTLSFVPPTVPMATVPGWLRRAVEAMQSPAAAGTPTATLEDAALAAGAAIATLDTVVRRQERWAGAWRQRLALAAAVATARQAGRAEDEAALRDAVLLTKPGDAVGPAGRMFLAWRRLATRPIEDLLTGKNLAAVLEELGYAHEATGDLAAALRQDGGSFDMAATTTGALMAASRQGLGHAAGAWLADALLARQLGWAHALPLLGAETTTGVGRRRRADAGTEADCAGLLAAQARAALRAIDLFADLGRRANRLIAVAPKLRARGADSIVERLLDEDALVASRGDTATGMSDRALRRLFDRLVALGAVRELSGRPAFRVYGL